MDVNDWMEGIKKRRSIRRFTQQEISPEVLANVFEAVRWAPSWANSQCCELVVVKDAAIKEKLSQILSAKNPSTLAVKNAPVTLAICGATKKAGYYSGKPLTKFDDWLLYDLGLVTQNICLMAQAQGLGSVIVGAFDHNQANEILALPDGVECVALLPMGYPDQAPSPPKRKAVNDFIHYDRY